MDQQTEKRFKNISKSKTFQNIVGTFALDKKSVLDIGCSEGEFLVHFGDGSVGLSIRDDEVKSGKARGLDIRLGNIESEEFVIGEKFDAIFANNIFEHLFSPHRFLIKIKNMLKQDGILILGVPCVPKITSLLRFRKFRGSLASAHINFYTKKTLTLSVQSAGWNVIATRGFHFHNPVTDHLLDPVYPHYYVVASLDPDFKYSGKRMKELIGYNTK